nr:NXPE family member 3-like isoform X6 [Labrus bergylta]
MQLLPVCTTGHLKQVWLDEWWITLMAPTLLYSLYSGKEVHRLRSSQRLQELRHFQVILEKVPCGGSSKTKRSFPELSADTRHRQFKDITGTQGIVASGSLKVTLVHSSEAITVLRRLNREHPDRTILKSLFRSGSISETTICNICLRQTNQPQCNYTDLHTGDPWFCYKPKKLSCDDRMNHINGGMDIKLKANEANLFKSNVNMQVFIQASGPANVTVLPQRKEQPMDSLGSGKSGLSGYYYQGVWRSLGGTKVHQFNNSSAISQCLKGKVVHMYGDSTVRQWFEYLDASLPDAKEINRNNLKKSGPFMIWDNAKNILVKFHLHGPPLSISVLIPTSELRYIANEIDDVVGGTNTVVIFGIWAHLTPFPMQFYIRRLYGIRRAVIRLLNRAPDTLVVIRTPNLRGTNPNIFAFNDWYAIQQDKVVRAVFKGLNVQLVDAWEMVLAHHLPHYIHPPPPIIRNMVNIILSHMCPQ